MDKIFIAPEELRSRLRSKRDLYDQLVFDRKANKYNHFYRQHFPPELQKMPSSLSKTSFIWRQTNNATRI